MFSFIFHLAQHQYESHSSHAIFNESSQILQSLMRYAWIFHLFTNIRLFLVSWFRMKDERSWILSARFTLTRYALRYSTILDCITLRPPQFECSEHKFPKTLDVRKFGKFLLLLKSLVLMSVIRSKSETGCPETKRSTSLRYEVTTWSIFCNKYYYLRT